MRQGNILIPVVVAFMAIAAFLLVLNFAIPSVKKTTATGSNTSSSQRVINGDTNISDTVVSNADSSGGSYAVKDWKTYTNTNWKFSFNYPGEWEVIRDNLQVSGDGQSDNYLNLGTNDGGRLSIRMNPTGFALGAVHATMHVKKQGGQYTVESKTVNISADINASPFYSVDATIQEGSRRMYLLLLSLNAGDTDPEFDSLAENIIASVKFF